MSDQNTEECPVCHRLMMESEFGMMCRRALQSWKCDADGHWKRSFAGHPEVNPAERDYLEKHGAPRGPEAATHG